jgi:hypothetical protein
LVGPPKSRKEFSGKILLGHFSNNKNNKILIKPFSRIL